MLQFHIKWHFLRHGGRGYFMIPTLFSSRYFSMHTLFNFTKKSVQLHSFSQLKRKLSCKSKYPRFIIVSEFSASVWWPPGKDKENEFVETVEKLILSQNNEAKMLPAKTNYFILNIDMSSSPVHLLRIRSN